MILHKIESGVLESNEFKPKYLSFFGVNIDGDDKKGSSLTKIPEKTHNNENGFCCTR